MANSSPHDSDSEHQWSRAETFLEEHGAEIHPALAMQEKAEDTKSFSNETKLHTQQFLDVMSRYQAQLKDKRLKKLNLRGTHTWEEVFAVAKDAEATYQDVGGNVLRKVGRFITDRAEMGMPLAGLIPNDFYFSILGGGLKLVFQAAGAIGRQREDVLQTLLQMPVTVSLAQKCKELFPDDTTLHEMVEKLYLTALAVIEGIIAWLLGRSIAKPIKALICGPIYGKPFKEKKGMLDRALSTLQNHTNMLQTEIVVKTGRTMDEIEGIVFRTEKRTESIDATSTKTLRHVDVIMSDLKSFSYSATKADDHLTSLAQDIKHVSNNTYSKVETLGDIEKAKEDARNAMAIVLLEVDRNRAWRKSNDRMMNRIKMQVESLVKTRAEVTHDDMYLLLRSQDDSTYDDLKFILRVHASPDVPMMHAATAVFGTGQFQDWFSSYASSMLFIEGEPVVTERRSESTLSLVSSTTIENYHNKDPAMPIWFFCNLHTSSSDPLRGPKGLMRCLILQILYKFQVPLDFISSHRYHEQLAAHDIYTLCDCFTKLVMKLPVETVLLCIIDGLGSLESEWEESCNTIVRHLQQLAEDDQVPVAFKLLVTCPRRSRLGDSFEEKCRLKLVDNGLDRRSSTEGQRRSSAGRHSLPHRSSQGSRRRIRSQRHQSGDSVLSEAASEVSGWTLDSEPENEVDVVSSPIATNLAEDPFET